MRALLPFSLLCFACLEPVEGRVSASTDTPSTSPDIAPDIGPDIAPDADGPDTPDATSDSDAATPCTTVRFESLTRRESTISPGYEMYITLKAAAVGSAPLAYHWALTEVPFGRDAQLSTPVRSDTAQFTATVPGTYEVSLAVTDAAGVRSCTATRRIDVPPPTYGLFIEALWTAPAEAPAVWTPRMGAEERTRLLKGWRGAVRAAIIAAQPEEGE